MNEYTELIAELRDGPDFQDAIDPGRIREAADAIEALVKERDELAAVIEKVGLIVDYHPDSTVSFQVSNALAAPADALREHDAALIESLADDRGVDASEDHDDEWWVGYRQAQREIIHWLTERARQVREGEA